MTHWQQLAAQQAQEERAPEELAGQQHPPEGPLPPARNQAAVPQWAQAAAEGQAQVAAEGQAQVAARAWRSALDNHNSWLHSLRGISDASTSAGDFLESTKMELFPDQVRHAREWWW